MELLQQSMPTTSSSLMQQLVGLKQQQQRQQPQQQQQSVISNPALRYPLLMLAQLLTHSVLEFNTVQTQHRMDGSNTTSSSSSSSSCSRAALKHLQVQRQLLPAICLPQLLLLLQMLTHG
jgi:hypothetical protein